jgi:hypothetical protein
MKSFQEFLQESVNIQHVDTLIVNGSDSNTQSVGEEFSADVMYQGSIHRISMVTENGIPSRNQLAEYLQDEYPGAIVQQIYVKETSDKSIKIKDDKRYHPAKLDWV